MPDDDHIAVYLLMRGCGTTFKCEITDHGHIYNVITDTNEVLQEPRGTLRDFIAHVGCSTYFVCLIDPSGSGTKITIQGLTDNGRSNR